MAADCRFEALVERFQAAALGTDSWPGALQALADITQSKSGQLIQIGADWSVPFNWITNVDPQLLAELNAVGGHDPLINPRVKAGSNANVFDVLAEENFISEEDHRAIPIYANHFARMDIPYICLTNIFRERDFLIGLTVNRSKREGSAGSKVKETLRAIAPHVRAAVRTQLALETQGQALIAGALDAVTIAAFVCDRYGSVVARTQMTEQLIAGHGPLTIRFGKLALKDEVKSRLLSDAISAAAFGSRQANSSLVVRQSGTMERLVLDIATLPKRKHCFTLEACVLVIARLPFRHHASKLAVLSAAFELTAAEAEVAIALHGGLALGAIAQMRGSSENTVKAQVKAIYAKMSVANRAEFAAQLVHLI